MLLSFSLPGMPAVVVRTIEKKDADDDEDDRPYQKGPILKSREKEDDEIHDEKNDPDSPDDPAGKGASIPQKKSEPDGHQKEWPGGFPEIENFQVIQKKKRAECNQHQPSHEHDS